MNKIIKFFSGLIAGIVLGASVAASAAGTASFSISGNGSSHDVGSNFTVTLYENSGSLEANSVGVSLKYDPSKVMLNSVSVGDFSTCVTAKDIGGGVVKFECTILGGKLTGNHPVGSMSFNAQSAGAASFVILSNASILDASSPANEIWNGAVVTSGHNIVVPAPAPVQTPSPAPKKKTVTNNAPVTSVENAEVTEAPAEQQPETVPKTEKRDVISRTASEGNDVMFSWYWLLGAVILGSAVTATFRRFITLDKINLRKYVAPFRKSVKQTKKVTKKSAPKKPKK